MDLHRTVRRGKFILVYPPMRASILKRHTVNDTYEGIWSAVSQECWELKGFINRPLVLFITLYNLLHILSHRRKKKMRCIHFLDPDFFRIYIWIFRLLFNNMGGQPFQKTRSSLKGSSRCTNTICHCSDTTGRV